MVYQHPCVQVSKTQNVEIVTISDNISRDSDHLCQPFDIFVFRLLRFIKIVGILN